jgi:hypothetical protein
MVMEEPNLFSPVESVQFDGETFDQERDGSRLNKQLQAVKQLMSDGIWRSLAQIAESVGYPEASVSARLRDLRKPKFGGYTVERKYINKGLHHYRVI